MSPVQRAALYASRFPDRPPLSACGDWVTGTWLIGACYKNPSRLYGAYPHGYLERVHAMFPDARDILHVFSGGLSYSAACEAYARGFNDGSTGISTFPEAIELVDLKGPEDGRHPTWQGDVLHMPATWAGRFDLILADPPYSKEDAEKYGVPMVNRGQVMRRLHDYAKTGGHLVWLDQVWPMHRKSRWDCWGQVGLVRSTNHRVRLVSFFQAL